MSFACLTAIAVALASNVFTVAKVLKIKSILKAAGGTAKAVGKIIDGYKEARAAGFSKIDAIRWGVNEGMKGLGTEAVATLLSLFSLTGVVNNCF